MVEMVEMVAILLAKEALQADREEQDKIVWMYLEEQKAKQ